MDRHLDSLQSHNVLHSPEDRPSSVDTPNTVIRVLLPRQLTRTLRLLALAMTAAALAEQAREALRLAEADPRQSVKLAAAIAEQARSSHDIPAAAIAERALGLAALHLDDADTAMRHLRTAIALGRRAGSPALAAEARMTLAYVLDVSGHSRQALREID